MNRVFFTLLFFSAYIYQISCTADYSPKPRGYPRLELPTAQYQTYDSLCPFKFEYSTAAILADARNNNEPCWFNIDYPRLNARIHLSYKSVGNRLNEYLEDSRTLVYKHTVKATSIEQNDVVFPEKNLYGRVFNINGDVASSVQFYATDSSNHFLRGALYFNAAANADSLQPAIRYISEDIHHLVNSLAWKPVP